MTKSDLEAYKISLDRCKNRLADKNAKKEVISSFGHGAATRRRERMREKMDCKTVDKRWAAIAQDYIDGNTKIGGGDERQRI